jgi:hypothetical protein
MGCVMKGLVCKGQDTSYLDKHVLQFRALMRDHVLCNHYPNSMGTNFDMTLLRTQ